MLLKLKIQWIFFLTVFILTFSSAAFGHCDSMEGPVVKASQRALDTGNINYVLIWVRAEDENEIKAMFDKVNIVRVLSAEAKELADMYFFETVVRIHRMREGVGYTGLKAAEYKPEDGIEAADRAIEENNIIEILAHLGESQHSKVKEYFTDLQSKKGFEVDDVAAGRKYVESYVHFIHYVESLYNGDMEQTEEHIHHH